MNAFGGARGVVKLYEGRLWGFRGVLRAIIPFIEYCILV